MTDYVITDFLDENSPSATNAIARAISLASQSGGGRVIIPSGVFQTGAIFLRSHIELHLASGAVLKFSDKPEDYPPVFSRWEGVNQQVHASCIYGKDLENIAITGFGTIDGNGYLWWDKQRNHPTELKLPRPKLISFERSNRLTIRDVQLINSPSWTVNPILCQNITIDNISIKNPTDSPNTDGIDPDSCQNVRISNCHIDVGDDCLVIKSGTETIADKQPCENITISNCTMVHGHGAIVIGSEMSGDIRNVVITNCIFNQTDRGFRFKSRRGRGGTVEDIRISNIIMTEVICPFVMNLYYFCGPNGNKKYVWDKTPYPIDAYTPCFQRIHFANITARNVHAAAGFICGLAEQPISDITFQQIDIAMKDKALAALPAMMTGLSEMKQQGFYLENVQNFLFEHVTIANHEGKAFHIENGKEIKMRHCQSKK
ncbi:endopolygalacturonase [Lactococcus hodotermopsidis]|uniref:Endopolygalacturonase n=1 Tax=Pseudolactococcus hodotermopsidis TaxID=2709157 RepID=A0A6A0BBB8_9LACT|nr:glycoside hydrolase family 28 protein [Lactococcus hodotermopsidis]GFH41945.1 endopolygalacturonase [Lactococcus hodotermopsidis]